MAAIDVSELKDYANEIRKLTLRSIGKLGVGHIGGSLSLCEVLAVLYAYAMNIDPQDPQKVDRDRFVLSKGHGGPALYSALALKGYMDLAELDSLNSPNTSLPSHCDMKLTRGIDMTTGSLGQGFSAACGMAAAAKMDKRSLFIYTLIGDGESQEGQIWEAALFAAGKKLNHLIAFTDYNRMQIDGYLDEVNPLHPLADKWSAFGWHVQEIDGHDVRRIAQAIDLAKDTSDRPSMIILHTVKGKGGYFCENKVSSHNMPVTEEEWIQAVSLLS